MTLSSRRARIARYVREVARSPDDHLLHSDPDVREVAGSLDDRHLPSHSDVCEVAGSPDVSFLVKRIHLRWSSL